MRENVPRGTYLLVVVSMVMLPVLYEIVFHLLHMGKELFGATAHHFNYIVQDMFQPVLPTHIQKLHDDFL